MSGISVIGIMLLILAGIVLTCLAACWMEKNFPSEKFDERQKGVRGRGYRLAFWVGVIYMLMILIILIGQVDGEEKVEPYLLVFYGFFIQAMVFHVYCLINHAALPFSEKPIVPFLGYTILGIMNLASFRNTVARWPLSLVGHGTTAWTSLVVMFSWFSLAFMYLIQLLRREKE